MKKPMILKKLVLLISKVIVPKNLKLRFNVVHLRICLIVRTVILFNRMKKYSCHLLTRELIKII